MQPPRPSKDRGRNHQHASTTHEVCINYRVQRAEVSFHVGFIQEVAGFGVELAFRGYLPQKTSSISRRSCETGRETRERRVCVVGCKKNGILRNSYVDFIFSYH